LVGVVTSGGRLHRVGVVDLPALAPTGWAPNLRGGAPVREFVTLERDETVVGVVSLADDGPGIALATAQGVVKRVTRDFPAKGDVFDVIALRPGDSVVGVTELSGPRDDLVFVTSDAQLLRTPAAGVRPQGRSAGGMAGVKLAAGAQVVAFASVDPDDPDAIVVTVAGSSGALAGTAPGTAKVTPYADYPPKGRATAGVRCQRFLRGEDTLVAAWVGIGPAFAAGSGGEPVDLPGAMGRRDGSGTPVGGAITGIGGVPTLD
jgi:DNA gyrase subunit A